MKLKTRDIVYIGFIAALCAVATTIRIEIPGGAMVHLGSAALFTSSILFGGLYGGLGAAIGSALFDLFGGHTQYIVFYFLAWWFVLESAAVAASKIQYSLITSAVGIVVAIILTPKLQSVVRKLFTKH